MAVQSKIGETVKTRSVATGIAVLLMLVLVTTAFAAPAGRATPFKGSWDSLEIPTFDPPIGPPSTMYVDGHAWGNATHLGKYTATFAATVNLVCGCSVGDTVHFIAANGDSLDGVGSGSGGPSGTPGFNLVTQTYAITGGTGRFAGATGSFTVVRLANNATGVSSGSFTGEIVLH
jgi:hypothetical protein